MLKLFILLRLFDDLGSFLYFVSTSRTGKSNKIHGCARMRVCMRHGERMGRHFVPGGDLAAEVAVRGGGGRDDRLLIYDI